MTRKRGFIATIAAAIVPVGLLGIAAPSVASAEEYPAVTLTSTSDTASWSGEFAAGAFGAYPAVSLPQGCTPQLCDVVPLDVQLPGDMWRQRPGGMLVAIDVPLVQDIDLDLFVYGQDGSPAAQSASGVSDEAAWIENPGNGRYTVVVAPKFVVTQPLVDDVLPPIDYAGFVKFQRGMTVHREEVNLDQPYLREFVAFGLTERQPVVELLPDLVPTTPRNFSITYELRGVPVSSCLPTESLGVHEDDPDPSNPPLRCLRFDQGEYNFGDGPLQLNVYEDKPGVYQRIYSSDGTVRQRLVGDVKFNDAHGHFHYLGFQQVTLHRIEQDGSLTFVKQKPDKGICMGDAALGSFGRTDKPTSPMAYPVLSGPSCQQFSHKDPDDPNFPDTPFFEMGISVGWADIYPTTLPEQYIDITDRTTVPDGDYALVVRQDVEGHIQETSTRNNTAIGCVRITGDEAEEIACDIGGRRP